MSTVGQAAGYVIGGVVGAAFPAVGWVIGAQIGGMIGGYIDPPKGKNSVGPRLEDLTVQTSTYGAVLPRLKGTIAVTGNVFWLEGDKLKEITNTKKVGGKGGPTAKQTTFSYTATFAVGLAHQVSAPIVGIRRLWLGNALVYDAGSTDLDSIIASNIQEGISFKVYSGADDQQPDPRMQADKGINNVSGYPGRCYIVFYDLDLTEHYNNSLLSVQAKVEVVTKGSIAPEKYLVFTTPDASTTRKFVSASVEKNSINYAVARFDIAGSFYGVDYYESRFGEYVKKTSVFDHFIGGAYGLTYPTPLRVHDNFDGENAVIVLQFNYFNFWTYFTLIKNGAVYQSDALTTAEIAYGQYDLAAVDGTDSFLVSSTGSNVIVQFKGADIFSTSSASVRASSIGLSENRIFVANYAISTTVATVSIFDRADLSHIADYTQPVNGSGFVSLHVISDSEFYLAADESLSWWVSGIATDFGNVLNLPTGAAYRQVRVFDDNRYYVQFDHVDINTMQAFSTNYRIVPGAAKLREIVTDECALAGLAAAALDLSELIDSDVRGYRVSQAGSVRAVLEQLQAAFPFDVIQSGYKVKFKSRGGAAALTVNESDLGAHTGNETPSRFMLTTEMPSQVPAKVTFNFLNADREYDPDEQSAAFTAQDVKNSYTVSLPLVMTPTEALQAADVLLKKEQRERTSAGTFWLPPADDYRKLEAADVISVIAQGRTNTIRLTKLTQLPDGRIECDGKLTDSAAYVSSAVAQNSLALGQSIVPLAGSSELLLLDLPRMVIDQDVPGVTLGMYGYTPTWPGGAAFRSDDFGQTYAPIASFLNKSEVFTVAGLPASVQSFMVDRSSSLVVTPAWAGADLSSITDVQLYSLGNLAAYGAHGRWEIIAFKTAVDNGNGTYTLSNLLRGRYGTEWAMSLHAAGDFLVMLDVGITDFSSLPLSALNAPRRWRGVTSGASIDSVSDNEFSWTGENLRPLSPVYVAGRRNPTTFDWTIEAKARTRHEVAPFSGITPPDGETTPAYEVDIWDSASFLTRLRTLSGLSSPSAPYTNAQQIEDFGLKQEQLFVDFYKMSSVVGRGRPLRATISCILEDDPYAADVFVLLHFDGSGATIIDEISGNSWTAYGGATQSTADPKFGSAALALDGSGDYIGMTFGSGPVGTGDFTFEWWEKPADAGNRGRFMLRNFALGGAGNSDGIAAAWNGSQWNTYGNSSSYTLGGSANSTSAYTHMAMERFGGTIRLYVAGTPLATTYTDNTDYSAHVYLYAGVYYSTAVPFNGLLDEFRGTAAARYRGNPFTPPAGPFSNP